MIETSDLYQLAEQVCDEVIVGKFPENGSLSIMQDGMTFIGINDRFASSADERVHLAHECGHCARQAFYSVRAPIITRGKAERQADEYAIERLVPEGDFFAACERGAVYPWQIADEFGITPKFAEKVMTYYLRG